MQDTDHHDSRHERVGRDHRQGVHVQRYGVENGSDREGSNHRDEVVESDVDTHPDEGYTHGEGVHDGRSGHLQEGNHHDEAESGNGSGRYGEPRPGSGANISTSFDGRS